MSSTFLADERPSWRQRVYLLMSWVLIDLWRICVDLHWQGWCRQHHMFAFSRYRAQVPRTHYVIALILPKVHMRYSMGYDRPLTIWMIVCGAVHRSQWCRQHPIFLWWRETYSVDMVCLNTYIGSPYRIYTLRFFSLVSSSAPIFWWTCIHLFIHHGSSHSFLHRQKDRSLKSELMKNGGNTSMIG